MKFYKKRETGRDGFGRLGKISWLVKAARRYKLTIKIEDFHNLCQ